MFRFVFVRARARGCAQQRASILAHTKACDKRQQSTCSRKHTKTQQHKKNQTTHVVDRAEVFVVHPAAHLDKVHQAKLPREQAAEVDVLEGAGQVLRQRGLVPPHVGLEDLLPQHAGDAEHRPARVHELRLAVPVFLFLFGDLLCVCVRFACARAA